MHQEMGVYVSGKGGCVSEKGCHVSCMVLASTSGHGIGRLVICAPLWQKKYNATYCSSRFCGGRG